MKKYFALSDIHSRKITLNDFINKGFDPDNDNHIIVLLGDYFDRYDDSYDVLLFVEEVMDKFPNRSIVLKGNHDEMLENIINQLLKSDIYGELHYDRIDYQLFISNGGRKTLRDLFGGMSAAATMTPAKMQRAKRISNFLSKLDYVHETDKYIFVHAGFAPDGTIDTWTIDTIHNPNNTGKKIVAGHFMFEYLENATISDYGKGKVATSNIIDNDTYLIDSGSGDNIVIFKEE